ncbi:MAG: TolC family protein [Kiritimatiellia bacterium]
MIHTKKRPIRRQAHRLLAGCMLAALPITSAGAAAVLETLIAQALEQNHGLHALNRQIDAAEATQREARAAYFPQMGASLQYIATDNAPQAFMLQLNQRQLDMRDPAFDPNQPDDTTNLQMSLGVHMPLYHAARQPRQHATRLQSALSRQNMAAARNALVHAVTQGYYQVLEAQAFAAVQQAAQLSFTESLRVARERFESGAVVRTDVLNLEVQLAQANENLIRARNGIQLAIAALNATIGMDTVSIEGLPEPDMHIPAPHSEPLSTAARPELAAAHLQHKLASEQIRIARAGTRPNLYLFGSVIWDGERLNEDREESYIAGVALDWNWFDGGRTRARTDAARAMQDSARASIQQTLTQLELEAKQAYLHMQEAWQRIQVTEHASTSADEALRITRALYQEGAADIATLLVAELALTETRMRATAARYDYLIALSNAKRTAGLFASISHH